MYMFKLYFSCNFGFYCEPNTEESDKSNDDELRLSSGSSSDSSYASESSSSPSSTQKRKTKSYQQSTMPKMLVYFTT